MYALLNYNSEITGKKRKRNKGTNFQCNSKVRKIRKIEESKYKQEDTSLNQDESKDWDEPIDEGNDKKIAGNGDNVDQEISKNSHFTVGGSAFYTMFSGLGKPFGDMIRPYRLYVKASFVVCTVGFDEYKKCSSKDH